MVIADYQTSRLRILSQFPFTKICIINLKFGKLLAAPQLLQSERLQPSLLHATRPPNLTTSSGPFRVRMGCSSELKGTDVTVELSLWVVEIMGFAESEHVC